MNLPRLVGRALRPDRPSRKGPSPRLEAAILAILLGDFGFHKFYLGQYRQGLIYLLFCWSFVPGILGLFEGLGYLLMSDRAFAARFGK